MARLPIRKSPKGKNAKKGKTLKLKAVVGASPTKSPEGIRASTYILCPIHKIRYSRGEQCPKCAS